MLVRVEFAHVHTRIADDSGMDTPSTQAMKLPKSVVRLFTAGVAIAAFLAIASVINPGSSNANQRLPAPSFGLPEENEGASSGPRLVSAMSLGSMQGREYSYEISAGQYGGRYTVLDANGNVLLRDAYSQDIYESLPDADVRGMIADVDVSE